MPSPYPSRTRRLQEKLSTEKLAALLILHPPNITYLTGMPSLSMQWRSAALLLGRRQRWLLISPLEPRPADLPLGTIVRQSLDFPQTLASLCRQSQLGRVGYEAEHLTVDELRRLRATLGATRLIATHRLVEESRLTKDEFERRHLRRAGRIAADVLETVRTSIRPGQTEQQVAWEIESRLREAGADGLPLDFSPLVAFGEHSAIPHHTPTDRKLRATDIVLIDFGCTVAGYASDITRTWFNSPPQARMAHVLTLVNEAQRRALAKLRVSDDPRAVDRAARDYITTQGFGEYFIHGTGHGVGLAIHEGPSLNPQAQQRLQPGMVVTVEPGIYLPGKFGIRQEDTVLIGEHDLEILTKKTTRTGIPKDSI